MVPLGLCMSLGVQVLGNSESLRIRTLARRSYMPLDSCLDAFIKSQ